MIFRFIQKIYNFVINYSQQSINYELLRYLYELSDSILVEEEWNQFFDEWKLNFIQSYMNNIEDSRIEMNKNIIIIIINNLTQLSYQQRFFLINQFENQIENNIQNAIIQCNQIITIYNTKIKYRRIYKQYFCFQY